MQEKQSTPNWLCYTSQREIISKHLATFSPSTETKCPRQKNSIFDGAETNEQWLHPSAFWVWSTFLEELAPFSEQNRFASIQPQHNAKYKRCVWSQLRLGKHPNTSFLNRLRCSSYPFCNKVTLSMTLSMDNEFRKVFFPFFCAVRWMEGGSTLPLSGKEGVCLCLSSHIV